jgi:hypothetical protein
MEYRIDACRKCSPDWPSGKIISVKRRTAMKKRMVTAALALVFALSMAGVSMAAKVNCTVKSVEGDTVTMTCEGADKMKADDKVKVTTAKGGGVEGC